MHPKLERNKAIPPRAIMLCMLRLHAEVSGNTATYAPLARVVGQKGRAGDKTLVEKNLIRVVRLYITTGGALLPNEEGPSHADEMRWMDCRGFEVLYFSSDRLGSRDNNEVPVKCSRANRASADSPRW
jgi:hypothetical protein